MASLSQWAQSDQFTLPVYFMPILQKYYSLPDAFQMDTNYSDTARPEMLAHLRWVARISLWIGIGAGVGLAVVLYLLTSTAGQSYGGLIQSYSLAQYRLGPAMLIGGLFLLVLTAALTGLIALYSSFRVAGPLFRLSSNLEVAISQGPVKPVPIRDSDDLHREALLLEEALGNLASYYDGLRLEIDQAIGQLDVGKVWLADRRAICTRLLERTSRALI